MDRSGSRSTLTTTPIRCPANSAHLGHLPSNFSTFPPVFRLLFCFFLLDLFVVLSEATLFSPSRIFRDAAPFPPPHLARQQRHSRGVGGDDERAGRAQLPVARGV